MKSIMIVRGDHYDYSPMDPKEVEHAAVNNY
jgi:hypothetical protein